MTPAATRRPLRRVGELLATLDPTLHAEAIGCDLDTAIGPPKTDSRTVEPGDCFIAGVGLAVGDDDYIDAALGAGAALVVMARGRQRSRSHPRIVVDDVTKLLPSLVAGWYGWPGERLRLAGITGTNGKTSTAYLVASVLHAAGHRHLRLGTTGNWIVDHESPANFTTALPVELQQLLASACERGATHGVMEVSSHGLDQARIAPLRYTAVALTSFSQDHLDYHSSMAAYLQAKCLLARVHCMPSGLAIAPREHAEAAAAFLRAAAEAGVERRWRSSRTPVDKRDAEIAVVERDRSAAGLVARLRTPIGPLELRSPLVGDFNLDNLMSAIGLSIGLGVGIEHIEAALGLARGAPGRLEAVALPELEGREGPAVYVDYAHTPDAVARSLEALRPLADQTGGKLVILLGCGGDRDTSKRSLMGEIASRAADRFIATSDNPRTEDPEAILDQMIAGAVGPREGGAELIREVDRARAISLAISEAGECDVLLLAGKGHEDYQVLGTTKIHFDDREQAELALRARTRPG